jgi:hypothetical protein
VALALLLAGAGSDAFARTSTSFLVAPEPAAGDRFGAALDGDGATPSGRRVYQPAAFP